MNELKDLEEEIYKCSRCGLCQSVCPVFAATLNECAVSRGKFNILNGIVKGELKLTPKVKEYLDMCTSCNACKNFCPSKIDAKKIFLTAKANYHQLHKQSRKEKILNSYVLFKTLLLCGKLGILAYRIFKIGKLTGLLKPCLSDFSLGKKLLLMDSLAQKSKIKKSPKRQNKPKTQTAYYFEGCFNQYLNSETKDAVKKILTQSNIKLLSKNFECCGVSYLNDGNIRNFKSLIKRNTKGFGHNYDYIITDCASCRSVLKEYQKFVNTKSVADFSKKTVSVMELISKIKFKTTTDVKVAIHKPCHESYDLADFVKNIEGINFVEVQDFDKCCGFSGKFALQYEEISQKISKQKVQHYTNANVDIILTTCPACLLGLNQGLIELKTQNKPIAMNLYVFLANFCNVA